MKTQDAIQLAILGALVYALYKGFNIGKSAADATSTAIAKLWLKWFPLPPSVELLGNVKFPGNLFVPLQQLSKEGAIKQNPDDGGVYVKYAGAYWKLSPQVYGNWPATRIE